MSTRTRASTSKKPERTQAVIYARVSSKEQEKEGYSIPAQLRLLREYAIAEDFEVALEYVDVETAKQSGRVAFGEMVAWLRAHQDVRVILVEKTDRLYRNLKDWVTVDELDAEIHFPKEGVVPFPRLPLLRKVHARHQGSDGEETISTTCRRRPGRVSRKRLSKASGRPRRLSAT